MFIALGSIIDWCFYNMLLQDCIRGIPVSGETSIFEFVNTVVLE